MAVLRFQRAAGVTSSDLTKQLPAGTFTSVSVPEPGHMIDVTVTAGGVNDATAYMATRGYTLFATDPAPTLEEAAAVEVPPIDRMKISGGTVLTVGAVTDGQTLTRSGTTLIGSSGTSFDIRDQVAFDHFVSGSTTTERIGIMGWVSSVTGTGADLTFSGEAGHPGIADFGAGTVAGGKAALYLGDSGGPLVSLSTTQNQIEQEWLVRFNTNALSSVNMERFIVGFGDNLAVAAGTEQANGVYCEFDPAASANFQLTTALATVRTKVVSSTVVTANNWWRIGVRMTYPAGVPTAALLINGTSVATTTLTIPVLGLGVGLRIEANVTASEARCQADYMKLTQVTEKET
jgi:hypothetical protein